MLGSALSLGRGGELHQGVNAHLYNLFLASKAKGGSISIVKIVSSL
jgi:hypothetical protein